MTTEPTLREAALAPGNNGQAKAGAAPGGRPPIVPLLMAIVLISHFNRISISTAGASRIMDQYGIEPTRMGVVYSAFLFTYTLMMIPGGLYIDRLGTRVALATVGLGSAAFVALTGAVGLSLDDPVAVFYALILVRGLMGIFSAPLHPAAARAVGRWVAPQARSKINGLVNGSALLGIAATPPVFGRMIDRWDWPVSFLIMGGLTAVVALAWTLLARDGPEAAEESRPAPPAPEPAGSWLDLLKDRDLVLLTLTYAAVGYFQYMFFYWMSYYFEAVLHLRQEVSQFYAAIPPLAMAVGMPLGGWLSDRLEHSSADPSRRKVVPMIGMAAGAALLFAGVFAQEPAWIVAWFALALGAVGMAEGPSWATAIELGGRRGGSSAALFNTGGNAGGILAPIITPAVGNLLGWPYAVALGALVCLGGLVLWFWIDPRAKSYD
ncbi:MAG: MFS transporter [Isosphaeraceae bacterium]